ncbi:hypothetical protein AB4Z19_01120 [Pseudoduganella sp. RAF19]|uniref:hypothetical protein n=1 Tax=Pseudoduganella sp. RAF19 TaxID=3233052 RepID=UPI003F9CFD1D
MRVAAAALACACASAGAHAAAAPTHKAAAAPRAHASHAHTAAPVDAAVQRLPGEPQAVFVKDGAIMSPVATVAAGSIDAFPSASTAAGIAASTTAASVNTDLAQRYFLPGRAYYLYGDGAAAKGIAAGPKKMSCESLTGAVAAPAGAAAPTDGVLTNFALGPQGPAARAPTADEQKLITQMAKQLLKRQNVPPHYIALLLGKLQTGLQRQQSQAVLALPGKTRPLLFASYALDWTLANLRGSFSLTFIAEPNDTGVYIPTYRDFDNIEGEGSGETRKFLANVDLNGDGSDELILSATGGEHWWYEVLSRVNGKWTLAAKGGGGGC